MRVRSFDGNLNYISEGDDVGVGACKRVGPANKKSFVCGGGFWCCIGAVLLPPKSSRLFARSSPQIVIKPREPLNWFSFEKKCILKFYWLNYTFDHRILLYFLIWLLNFFCLKSY